MANNYNSNQGKMTSNGSEIRRNTNEIQMVSRLSENQNILFTSSQTTCVTNPLITYQSASFGGLYTSPGFNNSLPVTGYENNIQWLTDNRIQSQHVPDKNIAGNTSSSHTIPPTTSHSCCVNRFGVLDSLGMSSPHSTDQVKSTCEIPTFQGKSTLTMNMIDPIQSWLNFQMPSQISGNQQYCKYNDRSVNQNYSVPVTVPPQINLPVLDQSDLKQNDMCLQSPDTCFDNLNSSGSKHIDNGNSLKPNSYFAENKHSMIQENSSVSKQQSSYQSSYISKDWKSTFQSMQNYISSPNMFSGVNESQENFLFAQYAMPPTNPYYSSDNFPSFLTKNNPCISQAKSGYNTAEVQNSFTGQNNITSKQYNSAQSQESINGHYIKQVKESEKIPPIVQNICSEKTVNYHQPNSLTDCCQTNKTQGKSLNHSESNNFSLNENMAEHPNIDSMKNSCTLESEAINKNEKRGFKSTEGASSESDESNIIVEESDDIGEIESEISIEEIKKSYQENDSCVGQVLLRCLVCNSATSSQTPANQFIHMNESFPLTSSSRTPIRTKLEQILPLDLQHYLKMNNSFVCRRCLNLIETVEILEVKLTTTKQKISDNFSKTIQQLMPELEQFLQREVQADVEKLLQNDSNTLKTLPSDGSKAGKSFDVLNGEQPVDDLEYRDDENNENKSGSDTLELQCPYCSKVLATQHTLSLHLQLHTKEFRFYCERCGKGFPRKSTLEKHLRWHYGEGQMLEILCEICGEIFSSKNLFASHHLKNHSGNYSFKCEVCGKGFTKKISLEIHSHKHTGVRPFVCEFCGHTFTSESNLKSHIKICTKDLAHKCEECGKSFVSESQLIRHESEHSGVYKINCSVCSKGFHQPSQLSYHMRSHSTEKQFKCSSCDKAFKTMWNLSYHAKVVHKEEKIHKCSVCGTNFPQRDLLSDHIKLHVNERPYKCSECEKSFTHQTTFITHLKTHTGKVKLKICQVCGKPIKTRMSVHMRTHTGERPYKCTYCPLAFSVGITLKKHIQAKHCKKEMLR